MGKPALYGILVFGVSIGVFLLSVAMLISSGYGLAPYGNEAVEAAKLSGIAMFASIALIGIDFAFLSNWGRAKREVRYDPIPRMELGICMPAYNEEKSIAKVVNEFKRVPGVIDLVVRVDGASTDRTVELARAAGARVVIGTRHGYGYACMEALRAAKGDIVILLDSDGTYSAEDVKKLLAYIENADMVVGTRTVVEVLDPDSQVDWFINWGNKFIARMLQIRHWGKVRLSDVGCTYRAIRKDALDRILPRLGEGGNTFSPHMIMVALENGLTVIEVPVTFRQRIGESKGVGNQKVKGFLVGLKMLWHIFTQ